MGKSGDGFKHIQYLFPKICSTKINEGIFVGPDIRKLISKSNFVRRLDKLEQCAWLSIIDVTRNLLGNKISANYKDIISNLLKNFQALRCNMSLKNKFSLLTF